MHGGGDVGAALCAAPEVGVISFTGSPETGAAVARAAGAKRLVLELGGNAATIVCEDADIARAAGVCARTGYSNSGQSCISVQRVYVHRSRYRDFLDAFEAAVGELVVGDPLDPGTDVGSMVDDDAAERVVSWAAQAAAGGGAIVRGGTRDGAVVTPTIVADPPADAAVVTAEVFGALVSVLPYDDFDAVLDRCNSSRFGLQAGIFTSDIGRIVTAWRELEVGGLVVNGSSNFRLDHVPFGGVKDSGFGRESPRWMIEDYTIVKTLLLRGVSIWGERLMTVTAPTGAEALVALLERYGVRYVFGTCGHTNIAVLDALAAARSSSSSPGTSRPPPMPPTDTPAPPGNPACPAARRPRHDERGHRRCHRGPGFGTAGRDNRRHPVLPVRAAPAPRGQPPRRRRPDRGVPAVRQAGPAPAPGRGPAPVHRARVLVGHLRPARAQSC